MMAKHLRGLFVLGSDAFDAVYAPLAARKISERVDLVAPPQTAHSLLERMHLLGDIDLLFSGWGIPNIDTSFLEAAPNLKVIFYGGGAINGWCTLAVWERGISVTTANEANAIPVAEYTLATILFSLKHGWRMAGVKGEGFRVRTDLPGSYGSTIGLIGMGAIGRLVRRFLLPHDINVLVYDPYLAPDEADELKVKPVALEDLFRRSDVVSLHAAESAATFGMITGDLLGKMKQGATFINTARGSIVCERDLASVLLERPDLHAVLDVTEREPLPEHSPLHALRNITLTPHIAGSQGRECKRLGQYMVDELDRYIAGRPLLWRVPANDSHQHVVPLHK